VRRYSEALRSHRSFGATFELAIAPDSNISRATRSDTLQTIFGDFVIDEASKARSGTGLALSGVVYRRLALGSSAHDLLLRASGFGDLYRRSRFDDVALDLAAGPELRLGSNQVNLEFGATQRWYGLKPFTRSLRLGATWTRPLGVRTQLRLTGGVARIDNHLNDLQDGKDYSAGLALEHSLSPTLGIGINLAADRLAAKDAGYSTKGWKAGVLAWRELGRATITAEAEVGRLRADDRLVLLPNKRSDRYSRFAIGATFRQFGFGGFSPVARLVIERNRSSIEFYDYRRTRTEFGVTRPF
jgi:outer membrane protein